MEKTNYTKENLEFLTVAAETCKFFEQVEQNSPKEFLAIATKLLPLLYYKTVVVPVPTTISDEETERIVSEVDYEHIRNRIADLLGERLFWIQWMPKCSLATRRLPPPYLKIFPMCIKI